MALRHQFTQKITVNGWTNLLSTIQTAGYNGPDAPTGETTLLDFTTTPCYIHFYDSLTTNPNTGASVTATDGLPICTDTAAAPNAAYTLRAGTHLGTVWLYTGSSISVNVMVQSI